MKVEIVWGKDEEKFLTSLAKTSIPQREKREQILKNLCRCLGIQRIYKKMSAREAIFYKPEGRFSYQSATNTILELSERLISKS